MRVPAKRVVIWVVGVITVAISIGLAYWLWFGLPTVFFLAVRDNMASVIFDTPGYTVPPNEVGVVGLGILLFAAIGWVVGLIVQVVIICVAVFAASIPFITAYAVLTPENVDLP